MDVDSCWSIPPGPSPIDEDASVAPWVTANIRNNMLALLLTGGVAFIVSVLVVLVTYPDKRTLFTSRTGLPRALFPPPERDRAKDLRLVGAAGLVLIATWILLGWWKDFYTRAHGYAAIAFFIFLIAAVLFQSWYQWNTHDETKRRWAKRYAFAAALMVSVGVVAFFADFGEDELALLEAVEVFVFPGYWLAETIEKWQRGGCREAIVVSEK